MSDTRRDVNTSKDGHRGPVHEEDSGRFSYF